MSNFDPIFCTYTSNIVSVIKQFAPGYELNGHLPFLTALRAGIAQSVHCPSVKRLVSIRCGSLAQEEKLSEREADHSRPSIAEVTYDWMYNLTPPHAFMSCIGTN